MRNHKRLNPDPGAALQAKASDGLKIIVDPHHWFLHRLSTATLFNAKAVIKKRQFYLAMSTKL